MRPEQKGEFRKLGKLLVILCLIAAAPILAPVIGAIWLSIYIFEIWTDGPSI